MMQLHFNRQLKSLCQFKYFKKEKEKTDFLPANVFFFLPHLIVLFMSKLLPNYSSAEGCKKTKKSIVKHQT